jgi:two-component system nitrogen regulation response regulator GlnG
VRILVLTGQNEESNARAARALGAVELVPKPCEPAALRKLLARALEGGAIDSAADGEQTRALVGDSPPMRRLRSQVDLYAASSFPALIEGESGSGKERVAYSLHHLSARAGHPYLALNCAAISPNLVEATLFGYAKGAFTGAQQAKSGYFEDAGEGTLFLDEIGELPLELQAKLLRVLENGEYQRVGETQTRVSRARIVAATNRDLREEVRAGASAPTSTTASRCSSCWCRRCASWARTSCSSSTTTARSTPTSRQPALQLRRARARALAGVPFPGNVRELKNIVIRLTTKYAGYTVGEPSSRRSSPRRRGAAPTRRAGARRARSRAGRSASTPA